MNDPSDILEPIVVEARRVLEDMKKTEDVNERLSQSKILKNLCQSIGIFFDMTSTAMMDDEFPDFLEENDD